MEIKQYNLYFSFEHLLRQAWRLRDRFPRSLSDNEIVAIRSKYLSNEYLLLVLFLLLSFGFKFYRSEYLNSV